MDNQITQDWQYQTEPDGSLSIKLGGNIAVSKLKDGESPYYRFIAYLQEQPVWKYLAGAVHDRASNKIVFTKRAGGRDMLPESSAVTAKKLAGDAVLKQEYDDAWEQLKKLRANSPRVEDYRKFCADFGFPDPDRHPEFFRHYDTGDGRSRLVILWGVGDINSQIKYSRKNVQQPPTTIGLQPGEGISAEQPSGQNPDVKTEPWHETGQYPPEEPKSSPEYDPGMETDRRFIFVNMPGWMRTLLLLLLLLLLASLMLFFINQCNKPGGATTTTTSPWWQSRRPGATATTMQSLPQNLSTTVTNPPVTATAMQSLPQNPSPAVTNPPATSIDIIELQPSAAAATTPFTVPEKIEIKVTSSNEITKNRELMVTLEVLPALGGPALHKIELFDSTGGLLLAADDRLMLIRLAEGNYKAVASISNTGGPDLTATLEFSVGDRGMFVK